MKHLSRGGMNLVYALLLTLFAPILLWQHWRGTKRRTDWSQRIFGPRFESSSINSSPETEADSPLIWLHAVSVGEVNLLATLVPALRKAQPHWRFAISASTDTGLTLAKTKFPNDCVFRFPFDFSWAVGSIFRQLKPQALILTELEIWPNTISLADQNQVPVIVVNGRLSEKSFSKYLKIRGLIKNWFRSLTCVAAQTDTYAERFKQLGTPSPQVKTVGSMKFDAAETNRHNQKTLELSRQFGLKGNETVWLAGSTSAGEEQMTLEIFSKLRPEHPELKLIIVPRHRERFDEVAQLVNAEYSQFGFVRRSTSDSGSGGDWDILLVDTIGELSAWWGCADVAFVGGSFGSRGGQSMIEPAGYGVATSFGPNTSNFRDVVDLLLSNKAAVRVKDAESLKDFVVQCLTDESYRKKMGQTAQELVLGQIGATDRTVTEIQKALATRANCRGQ